MTLNKTMSYCSVVEKQICVVGSLLGTAVGDAIGLPYEGLSCRRGAKLLGMPDQHRLFFGRGMVSDDTEHACMTAQAFIASGGDAELFRQELARRLRCWLLTLPAGIGLATARAILRLWQGVDERRSGVFSAGNGAAMRAPIIGVVVDDLCGLRTFVQASTRLTHTDPKAEFGSLAVALAAHMASRQKWIAADDYLAQLKKILPGESEGTEFFALMENTVNAVNQGWDTQTFCALIGLDIGVSGYVFHTVPVVIHAWLTHQGDFRAAIIAVVQCGGDTDSTAALVGGIVGASVGKNGIPSEWLDDLFEWPRSIEWMERLGMLLGRDRISDEKIQAVELPFFAVLLRNLFFLIVVLLHGFRRLLPPY